jgi:hypothetical protein
MKEVDKDGTGELEYSEFLEVRESSCRAAARGSWLLSKQEDKQVGSSVGIVRKQSGGARCPLSVCL